MASGNYVLQQQQSTIESRIKTLINNDLKEICKAYNYQVSGTKPVLQKRCLEILDDLVNKGDQTAFDQLVYRVTHHGSAPPPGYSASSSSNPLLTNGSYSSYQATPSAQSRASAATSRLPMTGRYFKPNPFYEVVETALGLHELPDGPEMPQNRHTVRASLVLNADQTHRLRDDKNLRLLLYCGISSGMSVNNPIDVAFPNQLEVKINNDDVKGNYKGLKNKPGSTKPADITDKVRKTTGYQNQISVTYALTTKRFAIMVYLARYVSADKLMERIRTGRVIPKQTVLDEMSRANADPDIAATSVRMSLKDPISTVRITLPVRSTVCTHNQCFDGAMFLQLQEQAPQWSCPVCNKNVQFESLCVDKYFEDILRRTPNSVDKVVIEPNGEWRIIKEEEDSKPNGSSSRAARAAYDYVFYDEEPQEVVEPIRRPANGVSLQNRGMPSVSSSIAGPNFAFNTPPIPSPEPSVARSASSTQRTSNKRPVSAVIDLTLSDEDEDEPPRPAKRQSTSTHHGNLPHSFPPPVSIPETRYPYHHSGRTDSYRPSYGGESSSNSIGRNSTGPIRESSRDGPSASPTLFTHPSGGIVTSWPNQQQSRPTTSGSGRSDGARFPGFSIRPSSHPDSAPQHQQPQPNLNNSLRLPPMQSPQQTGFYDSWRNDYGNYSSSPSG